MIPARQRRAAEPPPAAAPAAELAWRTMRTLVTEQHDAKARVCAALGMSFVRVKALLLLATGPRTLREVAAMLACDPPYATVITGDLAARGLVVREPNPADGRSRLVTLTPAGHRAAARADRVLSTPPPGLRALPAEDLATLTRILTHLTKPPA
jgi:DNA-binding MarR family transcriptional regulator